MELLRQARCGDLDRVKTLIEQGVLVDTMNCCSVTALYWACEKGHTEVAQYLLDKGASVNLGAKPLIVAVKYNHYDCVKLLLEYHADANCTNSMQESPLSIALCNRQYSTILLLLQYDANTPASLDDVKAVQLLEHAKEENAEVIQKLVDENFINLTSENTFLAAFDFAFRRGSVELAEKLLSNDSHSQIEHLYSKAVYYSAKNNWPNIVSVLLEKGVDTNARTVGRTPLCVACEKGHEHVVRLLLHNGADPNVAGVFGRTALLYAIDPYEFSSDDDTCSIPHATSSIAEILLSAGANPNAEDMVGGVSPLYFACDRGYTELVKLLLSHGANPNIATVDNKWPIHAACRGLHYEAVKLLLEYNADVNVCRWTGKTALHYTLQSKSHPNTDSGIISDLVQLLLDADANVNAASEAGITPLYIACSMGLESTVMKMLECGARVDGNSGKKLPLIAACKNEHVSVVQLLLTNGANPNLQEDCIEDRYHGSFPLHIAATDGNFELVELLLKHGADIDVTDMRGDTALHRAVRFYSVKHLNCGNQTSVVDILLENKADVNKMNNCGETQLYLAASRGLLYVVNKMLEECGGNPNKGSPLVAACLRDNVDLVDLLLKHGADPNPTWTSCDSEPCDSKHELPLFVAISNSNSDIIRLLLNAGASVNVVNDEGKNVLCFAADILIGVMSYGLSEVRKALSTILLLIEHGASFNMKLSVSDCSPLYLAVRGLDIVRRPRRTRCVIELIQLMVKHGAMLQDSNYSYLSFWTLKALASFDGRHKFIVELFRAGVGFQLLALCCNPVVTIPREAMSISLCKAAIMLDTCLVMKNYNSYSWQQLVMMR